MMREFIRAEQLEAKVTTLYVTHDQEEAMSLADRIVVMAGGRIIVVSSDGILRAFDPVNGNLVHTAEIPGGAAAQPAVAGGTLYVVSGKGQLLAFR